LSHHLLFSEAIVADVSTMFHMCNSAYYSSTQVLLVSSQVWYMANTARDIRLLHLPSA